MNSTSIYILRKQDKEFRDRLIEALSSPQSSPLIFNAWGTGGIGKTRLIAELKKWDICLQKNIKFPEFSFGMTFGIETETPIKIMAKLYDQFTKPGILQKDLFAGYDPFDNLYGKYQDTIYKLKTQPVTGKKSVDDEQIKLVKTLVSKGAKTAGEFYLPSIAAETIGKGAEMAVDTAKMLLTEADQIRDKLNQHRATKNNRELQELITEPLPKLTRAFIQGIILKSKSYPIVLIFDTYEKAASDIDEWLCYMIAANPDLANYPVRILIAGRQSLTGFERWQKLQQDRHLIDDQELIKFDPAQAEEYLKPAGISDKKELETIYAMTKGLPYYLNWVREQKKKSRPIDLTQGNKEIGNMLLMGLDDFQKQIVKRVSLLRWFNSDLIKYLIDKAGKEVFKEPENPEKWFNWLCHQAFTENIHGKYRFDDVARDVFRHAFWQDSEAQFQNLHQGLAEYFETKAGFYAPPDMSIPKKYDNPDWRACIAESLYHALCSGQPAAPVRFISCLFEAHYLKQMEVVKTPFEAIISEILAPNLPFLNRHMKHFFETIRPVVENYVFLNIDIFNIEADSSKLEVDPNKVLTALGMMLAEIQGITKPQIQAAKTCCFNYIPSLSGLGKYSGILCQAGSASKESKIRFLKEAQSLAENLTHGFDTDFSSKMFLWDIASGFHDAGCYEDAIQAYKEALKIKPDKHEAFYNMGVAYSDQGQYKEAIQAYQEALKINKDDHKAFNNMGNAYCYQGQYKEAIQAYQEAVKINKDDHEAFYNMGNAYYDQGQYKEAIQAYQEAVMIKPDYHEAFYNMGNAYSDQGQYKEAIQAYQEALKIKPDFHEAFYNMGVAYSDQGQYKEAIQAYQEAVNIKKDKHEAFYNMGLAYSYQGQYEEAMECYDKAIQIKPDDGYTFYNKACCYALQKNIELCIENLKRAIELNPEYREMAKTDADFDGIRDDERFRELIPLPPSL